MHIQSLLYNKQRTRRGLRGVFLLVLMIAVVTGCGLGMIGNHTVSAEPQNKGTIELIQEYCKTTAGVPKAAQGGCTVENATHARNVATYHCTNVPVADSKKADCILRVGKSYIKDAADKHPTSAANFKSKLDDVLHAAGGNAHKPSADSNQAEKPSTDPGSFSTGSTGTTHDTCGGGDIAVKVSINFCCKGKGNPIADALFAIIRVLSDGVGLVIIASLIVGGIQYAGSRDDPQSVAMAVSRIRSTLFALLFYIFGYTFLNYLIPAGFLR